jgi:hypothetical protein
VWRQHSYKLLLTVARAIFCHFFLQAENEALQRALVQLASDKEAAERKLAEVRGAFAAPPPAREFAGRLGLVGAFVQTKFRCNFVASRMNVAFV